MRIIAGSLRGRAIRSIKDPGVRPISGRIKQSLFDIIAGKVGGSRFLDLFAGSGAVGLEALSRGAEFAFFVERNQECLRMIERNVEALGLGGRVRAEPGSALGDLSWIKFKSPVPEFDLIFTGPPYKTREKTPLNYTGPVLAAIAAARLLAPGGWVLCQHHVKEKFEAPAALEVFRVETYGDSSLSFVRWR